MRDAIRVFKNETFLWVFKEKANPKNLNRTSHQVISSIVLVIIRPLDDLFKAPAPVAAFPFLSHTGQQALYSPCLQVRTLTTHQG
jgi:hypothetical protein